MTKSHWIFATTQCILSGVSAGIMCLVLLRVVKVPAGYAHVLGLVVGLAIGAALTALIRSLFSIQLKEQTLEK